MPRSGLILLLLLSGCGIQHQIQAQTDLQHAKSAYETCLSAHKPAACESSRLAYEAELKYYQASSHEGLLGATPTRSANEQEPASSHIWMENRGGATSLCNNYGGSVNCSQ